MTAFSVSTLTEFRTALATAATNNQADVITLTANISATSGLDFTAGTGGSNLLTIGVTDSMTLSIVGGGFTLDANHYGRVLEVSSGTVAISNLTIREGSLAGAGGDHSQVGGSALGGGIYNAGSLTLTGVTVTANSAAGGGGGGGGYYSGGGSGAGGGANDGSRFAGDGGSGFSNTVTYPGGAASLGSGGAGGVPSSGYVYAASGATSAGGHGGYYQDGRGGDGGSAAVGGGLSASGNIGGGISIGGGGGGAGQYTGGGGGATHAVGAGGAAVGGIYNAGSLTLSGGAITGNVAAAGGGGGNPGFNVYAVGGDAVGGIHNAGVLRLIDGAGAVTGNVGVGGFGGHYGIDTPSNGASGTDLSGVAAIVNHAHTGGVSINGPATERQTLTAQNTLADADGLGTISYQWKADGVDIGGATSTTFVIAQAQVGKAISVAASYTDDLGFMESATSSATGAVSNINDAPTGSVTISGTVAQGQVLTAANTVADGDGLGTITYQWRANGNIIGGTAGDTFTLTQAEVGKTVTVSAKYTDGANTPETVNSQATSTVANLNDAPTGSVTITGVATQAQVLTAANTLADVDGLGAISYQWKSDGANISGATASTFTLTQAQVGHLVTVSASYTDGGNTPESVTSAATSAIQGVSGPQSVSVATLAQLKAALASAALDGVANTITLTADIEATGGSDFENGTGGRDLVKIALTDGMTLSIVGGGHTLDANSLGRVLEVSSGTVTISDLTIREGALAGDGGAYGQSGGAALGAGVYNAGSLTLTGVTVTANTATGGGGGAGGWYAGGGGGGGGPGLMAGRGGDGTAFGGSSYWGSDAVGGTGGAGGAYDGLPSWGLGGSSTAGAGGDYGSAAAGDGGVATLGGLSVGGGGGGSGGGGRDVASAGGVGGEAVGGIYNTGALTLSGATVSGNLAAGGGGGVNEYQTNAAVGGSAVGGLFTSGTLVVENSTLTGNVAGGGHGASANSQPAVADGSAANNVSGAQNHAPTGDVSLSGAATQGQTLTAANTLADTDGLGAVSYQWKADGVDIGGATGATFVLTGAEVGKAISVAASYADNLGTAESMSSTATAAVAAPTPAPTPTPTPTPAPTTTVDGTTVTTTTTTNPGGGQTQTLVVAPVLAGRPETSGSGDTADIPVITSGGVQLVTVGLPTGTGFSAVGTPVPGTQAAAAPVVALAIEAVASGAGQLQMAAGASAFLALQGAAPVVVQTITLSGANSTTPIAFAGETGSGVATMLVIDTHTVPGQTQLTLDNIDFAAIIGEAHITGGAGSQTVYADGAAQFIVLGADDDQLHGGAGNDTVGSAGGDDGVFGDDGDDRVFGGIGNDTVHGNAGDDHVQGNAGNDLVYGGRGQDFVYGGQGDDHAFGDLGNDRVFGDLGDDTVSGGEGDDTVQGNAGNDVVQGDAGNDLAYGGQGDDTVSGGDGADRLWGDLGNDRLIGGFGNDTLTGGLGADTFVFGPRDGIDRITDFSQADGDHIQVLDGAAYDLFQIGADTVIDFGAGHAIYLTGVQLSSLTSGWISA